jgi:hypothetical protein
MIAVGTGGAAAAAGPSPRQPTAMKAAAQATHVAASHTASARPRVIAYWVWV